MAILHIRSVPDDLYARLKAHADSERRSLTSEVILLLERAMALPDPTSDPAGAAYALRRELLLRQTDEWYRSRNRPISQGTEEAAWAAVDSYREAMREKYGGSLDSLSLLHAARSERDRAL